MATATWFQALNLTQIKDGIWRDDATGQIVCKLGAGYMVRPHQTYWAVVEIEHGMASVRVEGGDGLNAEHQGYLDAAFVLANRIAIAYNERSR